MPRVVIVLPLTPLAVGDSFAVRDWPLHITVVAPFETDAAPDEIARTMVSATSALKGLAAVAGRDELFGRREDVPVTVLVENAALAGLHAALVEAIRPHAAEPDGPAFTGTGFRPHVTVKHQRRLTEGDRIWLTQLALVDMAPRSHPHGRSVLATVPLDIE